MPLTQALQDAIQSATGQHFHIERQSMVNGGCINPAYRLEDAGQRYFVKTNHASRLAMFEAEADGLDALRAAVKTPMVIASGISGDTAFLILEWLELDQPGDLARLGHTLAAVHRITQTSHGWHRPNTLGITPQDNTPTLDWPTFWRDARLAPQLTLAQQNGYEINGDRLLAQIHAFFCDHQPVPSLLHGDLWSGNASFTRGSIPVLFDPACYFGDREADIAMTELFGGFGPRFMAAYEQDWPLDEGYKARRELYNLYHILNHLNLFGASYLPQAERMIGRLIAELKA